MLRCLIAALTALALVVSACSDDDDGSANNTQDETATPAAAVTVADPGLPTPRPTAAPSGPVVEVQGIVAVIDYDEDVIIINPLQGSRVDQVRVDEDTVIRSAGGGQISISEIRLSDRIIAKGQLAGGVVMIADEIAISQVVPGAEPGG
jgi:hypothetical protein